MRRLLLMGKRASRSRAITTARWLMLVLAVGFMALVAGWLALPLVPLPPALLSRAVPQLELVDRNGHPLRVVRPQTKPFQQRVTYSQIPPALVQATLAAEDRRFYRHPGVDWRGTARAAWQLVRHGHVVSGGSTITQQLIKLAEPRPRTLAAKAMEALQALRLEQVWDKQRILSEYLNRLEYGNFNTGCAAAAEFYFAKPLGDLSPAECALLAGLPQAPTRFNPHAHWERARKRQQWVLERLHRLGWLTSEESARAAQEPLRMAKPRRAFEAPHFVDLLLQLDRCTPHRDRGGDVPSDVSSPPRSSLTASSEDEPFPPCKLPSRFAGPQILKTTIDLELNRYIETAVQRQLAVLRPQEVHNAAVVVIENRTGDLLALVGSENYFSPASGQVNGAWAPRSAGSTFKPFTYLLAFEHGATPATIVADVPAEFPTATGLFTPVNYDRHCYGPMRYRLALANSLNISAVKVLASVGGAQPLLDLLRACGLSTLAGSAERYGLGLTIGNAEARLLELANAYACLARLGEFMPYRLLVSGGETNQSLGSTRRVADSGAACLIADILSDNDARTLAFGAESNLRFDFPVACKTGTSSDFRDNWAFGFTPEFTVGVWVGNFDGSPMRNVSGVSGAAPILHNVFEHLHERYGTTWYARRADVVRAWIHPLTGKRSEDGERSLFSQIPLVSEKFLSSSLPPVEDRTDYDAAGKVRLGSEYRDWFAGADNWLAARAVLAESSDTLRILFPLPGTIFYLDEDLPDGGRRVRLRAEGFVAAQWHSPSLECRLESGQPIALLAEGKHQLQVRDPRTGLQAQTWIEVLVR